PSSLDAAAPASLDAAPAPAPALDAAPAPAPADAPRRRPPRDASPRTVRPDASPRPPVDAAPPPPLSGTGRITIVGRGEAFLNIFVDGQPFLVTPQIDKPIAAGARTIVLMDPKTNQVVYRTTVVVEPGAHVRVQP